MQVKEESVRTRVRLDKWNELSNTAKPIFQTLDSFNRGSLLFVGVTSEQETELTYTRVGNQIRDCIKHEGDLAIVIRWSVQPVLIDISLEPLVQNVKYLGPIRCVKNNVRRLDFKTRKVGIVLVIRKLLCEIRTKITENVKRHEFFSPEWFDGLNLSVVNNRFGDQSCKAFFRTQRIDNLVELKCSWKGNEAESR